MVGRKAPRNIVEGSNKGGLGWTLEQFVAVDWRARARAVLGRDYGWDLRYRYTVDVAINLK